VAGRKLLWKSTINLMLSVWCVVMETTRLPIFSEGGLTSDRTNSCISVQEMRN